MSFILDALKKSDQIRQRNTNTSPSMTPLQPAAPAQQRRTPHLHPFGLGGIALLGVGFLVGWWQPWVTTSSPLARAANPLPHSAVAAYPSTRTSPQAASHAAAAGTSHSVATPPASSKIPQPAASLPAREPAETGASTGHATQKPPTPDRMTAAASPSATSATSALSKTSTAASATRSSSDSPPQSPATTVASTPVSPPLKAPPLPSRAELPANIQAELPVLSISAHSHSSKPGKGFVFMNDHMLREGDALPSGLKLEHITPDGMIFSYKGHRFQSNLQP